MKKECCSLKSLRYISFYKQSVINENLIMVIKFFYLNIKEIFL